MTVAECGLAKLLPYISFGKIYLYFSIRNGQPGKPALCQLYRHTFVPYLERHTIWRRGYYQHSGLVRCNTPPTVSIRVPSDLVIFDAAVLRTVGGKLGCLVDDPADGRFAEQVAGAAGRVTARQSLPYQSTEIDRRIGSMFAENVQQVLPHDVSVCQYWSHTHTHTHTHTHVRLTALCPGLPGWAGARKVKPIWILLKQDTVSGSGISGAICKSAPRSRQITMPVFYKPDALPAAQPTASKHWRQYQHWSVELNKHGIWPRATRKKCLDGLDFA